MRRKIIKSNEEWKKILTPEVYKITRERGTEAPFSGKYYLNHEEGTYFCTNCESELFKSDSKYDSGCGWPSFFKPLAEDRVEYKEDLSHGMNRIEVLCSNCGAHLGHVFNDGPEPTGQRYCINSLSLEFKKKV